MDNSRQNMEMENVVMLERDQPIVEEFKAEGKEISDIKIRTCVETGVDHLQHESDHPGKRIRTGYL